MALHTGQVTIPAGGKVALVTGVTPTATRTPCYELTVQNNSTHTIRVGDSTVSATVGQVVAASNAAPGPIMFRPPGGGLLLELALIFVFGTQGDVVDFTYVK